jgi:hypothetical protein
MTNVLSHLTAVEHLLVEQWERASAMGGMVVLSLVDRLPPVQRRYQIELEIRSSAFAAGRAYERESLGLPPVSTATHSRSGPSHVAALANPATAVRRSSARARHLHLV